MAGSAKKDNRAPNSETHKLYQGLFSNLSSVLKSPLNVTETGSKTRGRKRKAAFSVSIILLSKNKEYFVPPAKELQRLQRNHLGHPVQELPTPLEREYKKSVIPRGYTMDQLEDLIVSGFPHLPLRHIGFDYALADKGRQLHRLNCTSVELLLEKVKSGKLYLIPKKDITIPFRLQKSSPARNSVVDTVTQPEISQRPGPSHLLTTDVIQKKGPSPVKKIRVVTVTPAEETQDAFRNAPITDVLQRKILLSLFNSIPCKKKNVADADIPTVKTASLISGIKQTTNKPMQSAIQQVNCYNQAKINPPETSGCNLYSTIKTEQFVDPTLENVSSRETSGCNLYSTIKTEPFVDPTLENVSSREVTLSRQFCKPGDQVKIEPPETSGCNLYSTIKIEQFVDPTLENVASGDVTPSVQFCKAGEITLPRNLPVSPCQSTYEALHVSQSSTATATKDISIQTDFDPSPEVLHVSQSNTVKATKDISVQTDFDPSPLIVIDPSHVMILDPSQVSDLHPSLIPGFNPADIPGFDPSQISGYGPSQKYRAVYVNWKERVCGEPVEAMDGDLTETSDPQMRNELEQTPLQKLICSLENVKPNIEEVIRCTETIQAARDQVVEALDSLKVPGTRSNDRQEFVSAMETMVEAASNNVLNMIKQLANTTRQQQTQFIHLAGFVQKIKKEQGEMEEELLKFRRVTLKVRCASKGKRTLAPEYRKTKFRKNIIDSYTDISKIIENVQTRQMNTNDCSKIEGEQTSQCELCLSLPGPLETSVRHEFQNNRQSKDDRVTTKQIDNFGKITLIYKPELSFPTNSPEFLSSNETDFQKDCG